jgi:hypothetical protein
MEINEIMEMELFSIEIRTFFHEKLYFRQSFNCITNIQHDVARMGSEKSRSHKNTKVFTMIVYLLESSTGNMTQEYEKKLTNLKFPSNIFKCFKINFCISCAFIFHHKLLIVPLTLISWNGNFGGCWWGSLFLLLGLGPSSQSQQTLIVKSQLIDSQSRTISFFVEMSTLYQITTLPYHKFYLFSSFGLIHSMK